MQLLELKGAIVAKYGTQGKFAKEIGWTDNKMSRLVQGSYKPNTDEVVRIIDKLELDEAQYLRIFLRK